MSCGRTHFMIICVIAIIFLWEVWGSRFSVIRILPGSVLKNQSWQFFCHHVKCWGLNGVDSMQGKHSACCTASLLYISIPEFFTSYLVMHECFQLLLLLGFVPCPTVVKADSVCIDHTYLCQGDFKGYHGSNPGQILVNQTFCCCTISSPGILNIRGLVQ